MRLCLIVVSGLVLALNAQNPPSGRGVNFYNIETEVVLGKQFAADFRRTHESLHNAAARNYIEQMGARVVQTLPQPPPSLIISG